MTGPQLLAMASGITSLGQYRCVFCGAPANREYELSESFTTRDTLRCPGSKHICVGCTLALEEVGIAVYHTGESYHFTKAFRRMCSWVITSKVVTAATKAHTAYLRRVCLNPPEPPFVVSLAVSGQKHVLYRSVVNHDSGSAIVATLEGEPVEFRPVDLMRRLDLCGRLVSATGKPALVESPTPAFWFRVSERFVDGIQLCETWERVRGEPLSRLAAFLCPAKEEAEREYPGDRHDRLSEAGCGSDRPKPENRRGRNGKCQGGGNPTLFGDV